MAEIADLKPCPFCGAPAELREATNVRYSYGVRIKCTGCRIDATHTGSDLDSFGVKSLAIAAWNRRADDSKDKRIAELETALAPFAEASKDFDAECLDQWDIWEHPAALNITVGDLRRALSARLLNKEDRNG